MKKTLLIALAFAAASMHAQDRLVPFHASNHLQGYEADVKEYLMDGTKMLCVIMPSNWPEESLCWDSETSELIATKAISVIWNYRLYKDHRRRNPETEKPKLEKHRLKVSPKTENLIENLLKDAVSTAMYPEAERGVVLDGTIYRFYSGTLVAEHHHGAGENVQELLRLTGLIFQAVKQENVSSLEALMPDIRALRKRFR